MKRCGSCKTEKPITEFPKNKNTLSKLHCWCKDCSNQNNRKSYGKHKPKVLKRTRLYAEKNKWKYQNIFNVRFPERLKYRLIKCRCKKKNIAVCTQDEFGDWYKKQPRVCHYCGITELVLKEMYISRTRSNLSVDRLDPKAGYVLGNMKLACMRCNLIKFDFLTEKEMLEIAEKYVKPKVNLLTQSN